MAFRQRLKRLFKKVINSSKPIAVTQESAPINSKVDLVTERLKPPEPPSMKLVYIRDTDDFLGNTK
jgi:hypothetical protein